MTVIFVIFNYIISFI